MSKIALTNLVNLQNETTAVNSINSNNTTLITAFDNTLSRDGTSPNQMTSQLDMNSKRIINLISPISITEPVSLGYLNSILAGNPIFSGLITGVPVSPFMQPVVNSADLATLQTLIGDRSVLTGNITYFVSTTGSDANDGKTLGTPFLTLQKAVNTVYNGLNLNGFTATIQVADGTYTGGMDIGAPQVGLGTVKLLGNLVNPSNVVINTTNATAIKVYNSAALTIAGGIKMQTTTSGSCLQALQGATVILTGPVVFGQVQNQAGDHMTASQGGMILLNSAYSITGGASGHWHAANSGSIQVGGITMTLIGTPAFVYFAGASSCGSIFALSSNVFVGNATGQRYLVHSSANIEMSNSSGLDTFLPGTTVGNAYDGGFYNSTTDNLSWSQYTPASVSALVGTFNSTTANGHFKVVGRTMYININVTVNNVGTATTGFAVSLPPGFGISLSTAFAAVNISTGAVCGGSGSTAAGNVQLTPPGGTFTAGNTYILSGTLELQ